MHSTRGIKKLLLVAVPGITLLTAVPPLCLGYGMPSQENGGLTVFFALQKFMADGSVSGFFQLKNRSKLVPGAPPTEVIERSRKVPKGQFCIAS